MPALLSIRKCPSKARKHTPPIHKIKQRRHKKPRLNAVSQPGGRLRTYTYHILNIPPSVPIILFNNKNRCFDKGSRLHIIFGKVILRLP